MRMYHSDTMPQGNTPQPRCGLAEMPSVRVTGVGTIA